MHGAVFAWIGFTMIDIEGLALLTKPDTQHRGLPFPPSVLCHDMTNKAPSSSLSMVQLSDM